MRFPYPALIAAALVALPPAAAFAQAPATGIDIMAAIESATGRFEGRVIAADLVEGGEEEPDAVYSLRLLTAAGDIIEIRIDAADGTIFDVNGRGLVAARKPVQGF